MGTIKLYTEKQVNRMIELARFTYHSEDKILFSQTPIKLPSDEEIEDVSGGDVSFELGAQWLRNKIQNGNNE